MNINLNVKIKAGKRTPVAVEVYSMSVNEKTIEFANGLTITESQIASRIQTQLTKELQQIADA